MYAVSEMSLCITDIYFSNKQLKVTFETIIESSPLLRKTDKGLDLHNKEIPQSYTLNDGKKRMLKGSDQIADFQCTVMQHSFPAPLLLFFLSDMSKILCVFFLYSVLV